MAGDTTMNGQNVPPLRGQHALQRMLWHAPIPHAQYASIMHGHHTITTHAGNAPTRNGQYARAMNSPHTPKMNVHFAATMNGQRTPEEIGKDTYHEWAPRPYDA